MQKTVTEETVTEEMKKLLREELELLLAEIREEVARKKALMPKEEEGTNRKRRF
ncbi:hypothetical protein [Nitrosopumilus sp.]|uniref:hypothetical protein n=1 Tax=Nitrosopumilus sp. TaxID=2024843 RepID=UPI0034A07224